MIDDAERQGILKPGRPSSSPTSGNTGHRPRHGLRRPGYPFVAVMAESFSVERRRLMKALGAKVLLTPKELRASGMVTKAKELAAKHGWYLPQQFENPANPAYHRNTTGPEILRDFADRRLDVFVSGIGTGGTITGAGQMLKLARPEIKVVVTEPEGAAILSGKEWKPHQIQGWNPDFVPAVLDRSVYDRIVTVTDLEARGTRLGRWHSRKGSSAASRPAEPSRRRSRWRRSRREGTVLLAMLPDTGERYLSTFLFEGITEASDVVE